MNLLWAPGMSESAKEVCRNLTGREKVATYTLNVLFSLCVVTITFGSLGVAMDWEPFNWLPREFALPLAVSLVVAAALIVRRQRRLLVESQFAKANGLTKADIITRQPPSRSDYLILGGIAALSVTITLATVLAAFLMAV